MPRAACLRMTQPSLRRAVTQLENELAAVLLDRSRQAFELPVSATGRP